VPTLADIIAVLDGWFDPVWAESWDAVGLVCGEPAEPVERMLLAVDAVPATVAEALATRSQLLLTHHPLLLSGVHGVPADDPKGALVHRLVTGATALFVAHTNADVADPGVSDALARRIGLTGLQPLQPLGSGAGNRAAPAAIILAPRGDAVEVTDIIHLGQRIEVGPRKSDWMLHQSVQRELPIRVRNLGLQAEVQNGKAGGQLLSGWKPIR